jgi:hypothetical protein
MESISPERTSCRPCFTLIRDRGHEFEMRRSACGAIGGLLGAPGNALRGGCGVALGCPVARPFGSAEETKEQEACQATLSALCAAVLAARLFTGLGSRTAPQRSIAETTSSDMCALLASARLRSCNQCRNVQDTRDKSCPGLMACEIRRAHLMPSLRGRLWKRVCARCESATGRAGSVSWRDGPQDVAATSVSFIVVRLHGCVAVVRADLKSGLIRR